MSGHTKQAEVRGDVVMTDLAWLLPGLHETMRCPNVVSSVDEWHTGVERGREPCTEAHRDALVSLIPHLNDACRWTREEIADWLDTLDADLTFPTEPPPDPPKRWTRPIIFVSSPKAGKTYHASVDPSPSAGCGVLWLVMDDIHGSTATTVAINDFTAKFNGGLKTFAQKFLGPWSISTMVDDFFKYATKPLVNPDKVDWPEWLTKIGPDTQPTTPALPVYDTLRYERGDLPPDYSSFLANWLPKLPSVVDKLPQRLLSDNTYPQGEPQWKRQSSPRQSSSRSRS